MQPKEFTKNCTRSLGTPQDTSTNPRCLQASSSTLVGGSVPGP